jgi:hypothetical protein
MAAVDLCTFNHGLGIYIRILSLAGMNYFLSVFLSWNFYTSVFYPKGKNTLYRYILENFILFTMKYLTI